MAIRKLPDIGFVRECLDYDPATGVFTWRERPNSHFLHAGIGRAWNDKWSGKVAGSKFAGYGNRSFWCIGLGDSKWKAHRLAWLLVYGEPVPAVIDHINHDACDNRIANLRAATKSQNGMNQVTPGDNKSGVKGVFRHTKRYPETPFIAFINVRGKRHYLGYFRTLEEAAEARRKAAIALHGDFARHE